MTVVWLLLWINNETFIQHFIVIRIQYPGCILPVFVNVILLIYKFYGFFVLFCTYSHVEAEFYAYGLKIVSV